MVKALQLVFKCLVGTLLLQKGPQATARIYVTTATNVQKALISRGCSPAQQVLTRHPRGKEAAQVALVGTIAMNRTSTLLPVLKAFIALKALLLRSSAPSAHSEQVLASPHQANARPVLLELTAPRQASALRMASATLAISVLEVQRSRTRLTT